MPYSSIFIPKIIARSKRLKAMKTKYKAYGKVVYFKQDTIKQHQANIKLTVKFLVDYHLTET